MPSTINHSKLTIASALTLGIKNIQGSPEHIKDQTRHAENVTLYFQKQGLKTWNQVQMRHVLGLVDSMKKRDYSPNTIRLAVNTIRLTTNHLADYHGLQKLPIEPRHLPDRPELPKQWLTFEQIAQACEVTRRTKWRVKTNKSTPQDLTIARLMFLLCGICALRITEFARIEPGDLLDKERALIVGARTAKSASSRRIIPLPGFVYKELKAYLECPGQWRGDRPWSMDRTVLAKRARHALKWATEITGDVSFASLPPMSLRKTLTNELDSVVSDMALTVYYGHSVRGTMARNYKALRALPDENNQAVRNRAIEHLRQVIVVPIEKKCEGMRF